MSLSDRLLLQIRDGNKELAQFVEIFLLKRNKDVPEVGIHKADDPEDDVAAFLILGTILLMMVSCTIPIPYGNWLVAPPWLTSDSGFASKMISLAAIAATMFAISFAAIFLAAYAPATSFLIGLFSVCAFGQLLYWSQASSYFAAICILSLFMWSLCEVDVRYRQIFLFIGTLIALLISIVAFKYPPWNYLVEAKGIKDAFISTMLLLIVAFFSGIMLREFSTMPSSKLSPVTLAAIVVNFIGVLTWSLILYALYQKASSAILDDKSRK